MVTPKNDLQKGFVIADRVQYTYNTSGESASTINATLLDVLGPVKYKEFCRKLHQNEVPKQPVPKETSAYFSEVYVDKPGWHEVTLLDCHVKYYWGLSTIMNTVCSVL